jgi:hypothetical protein
VKQHARQHVKRRVMDNAKDSDVFPPKDFALSRANHKWVSEWSEHAKAPCQETEPGNVGAIFHDQGIAGGKAHAKPFRPAIVGGTWVGMAHAVCDGVSEARRAHGICPYGALEARTGHGISQEMHTACRTEALRWRRSRSRSSALRRRSAEAAQLGSASGVAAAR